MMTELPAISRRRGSVSPACFVQERSLRVPRMVLAIGAVASGAAVATPVILATSALTKGAAVTAVANAAGMVSGVGAVAAAASTAAVAAGSAVTTATVGGVAAAAGMTTTAAAVGTVVSGAIAGAVTQGTVAGAVGGALAASAPILGMGAVAGVTAGAAAVTSGAASVAATAGTASALGAVSATLAGPIGWALLGCEPVTDAMRAGYTWDCWKAVLRDASVEPSRGRTVSDVLHDHRVRAWHLVNQDTIHAFNVFGDVFVISRVILPNGCNAAHASLLYSL